MPADDATTSSTAGLDRLAAALERSEHEYARLLAELADEDERAAREVDHVLDAIGDAIARLSRLERP